MNVAIELIRAFGWVSLFIGLCAVVVLVIERRQMRNQFRRLPPPPRPTHYGARQYEINQRAYKSMR